MENPFGGLTHSIYYPRPSLAVPVPPPSSPTIFSAYFFPLSLALSLAYSLFLSLISVFNEQWRVFDWGRDRGSPADHYEQTAHIT